MSLFLISSDWRLKETFKNFYSHPFLSTFTQEQKLLDALETEQPNLLVIDNKLGKTNQANVLAKLNKMTNIPPVLLIEGKEAFDLDTFENLDIRKEKKTNLSLTAFLSTLEKYLHYEQLFEQEHKYEGCNLVGNSVAMRTVKQQLAQYAQNDCAIHLYGETGTGKEIAANYLHHLRFPQRKIVSVNCSLLSGSLGNAMFFGHAKGAFTDGNNELNGIVHEANNTTLFLDELETLSLTFQGHLLRLLENGNYRRYGDTHTYTSRFRLITASNEHLSELVDKQVMRSDFYYRICDVHILLPPLREHKEDIPLLCSHFFSRQNERRTIVKEDLALLQEYSWPGNVRQLFSILRRCMIKSKEREVVRITEEDLELKIS
jgi:two-component system NtrC family response regulator